MFDDIDLKALVAAIPPAKTAVSIGLIVVAFIAGALLKRLIKRRAKRTTACPENFWNRFWQTEQRFIVRIVGWLVWIAVLTVLVFIWAQHIALFLAGINHIYVPLARAVVIVIVALVALKLVNLAVFHLIENVAPLAQRKTARGKQRADTLSDTFTYGATIVIILVTLLMILDTFGIDLKAALATIGVASLAVGFGAQSLVKDVISGIFILVEDQYAVGDVVVINGEGGFVEHMTLRITQLRNTEGTLITIPNGQVDMVKNMTSEWSRVDYMMDVAYETDLDHAIAVLMDEAGKLTKEWPDKIIAEPDLKGVDSFNDSSITVRLWIRTKPLMQWDVKRELNRRVHKRFEKEGITIPFPQRTVWIKEPNEELLKRLANQGIGGNHA